MYVQVAAATATATGAGTKGREWRVSKLLLFSLEFRKILIGATMEGSVVIRRLWGLSTFVFVFVIAICGRGLSATQG